MRLPRYAEVATDTSALKRQGALLRQSKVPQDQAENMARPHWLMHALRRLVHEHTRHSPATPL
jgi:hypothetical protein